MCNAVILVFFSTLIFAFLYYKTTARQIHSPSSQKKFLESGGKGVDGAKIK